MARKRKFRARARSAFRGFKRRAKTGGSSENLMLTMGAAALYGATRPRIEAAVQPFTSKLPLGNYADEVALGAVGYFLAKGKIPMLKGKFARSAGKAILVIESARVGSGISAGMMPTGSSGSTNFANDGWG